MACSHNYVFTQRYSYCTKCGQRYYGRSYKRKQGKKIVAGVTLTIVIGIAVFAFSNGIFEINPEKLDEAIQSFPQNLLSITEKFPSIPIEVLEPLQNIVNSSVDEINKLEERIQETSMPEADYDQDSFHYLQLEEIIQETSISSDIDIEKKSESMNVFFDDGSINITNTGKDPSEIAMFGFYDNLGDKDLKEVIFPELHDDDGVKIVPPLKVYAQDIPSYSHDSITSKTVNDALESWTELNPDLRFEQVSKLQGSDIAIKWVTRITYPFHVVGITETNTREYVDSGVVSVTHEILIDLADRDCNGTPIFWDAETITNTIKHELGHTLGILHSSDENHLMYDPHDGVDVIDNLGYNIPEKMTEGYYVGEKYSRDRYDELDTKFVSTLAEYGWSVSDWDDESKSSTNAILYSRVNAIIDEINLEVEKNNCFIDTTNKYNPYGN